MIKKIFYAVSATWFLLGMVGAGLMLPFPYPIICAVGMVFLIWIALMYLIFKKDKP